MARVYKSARGKMIDMDKVKLTQAGKDIVFEIIDISYF